MTDVRDRIKNIVAIWVPDVPMLRLSGLGGYILEQLKSDRYELVQLPEQTIVPSGWDDTCVGCWPVNKKRPYMDPVSAWPNKGEEVAMPNGDFISADEARRLAVALIAAANAAEHTIREIEQ